MLLFIRKIFIYSKENLKSSWVTMNFFVLEYIQGVIMMKIIAAFDSFKESMTACEAGEAVQRVYNNVHICPLADGGEGTMEVMNR